jgi:hypothetical protein
VPAFELSTSAARQASFEKTEIRTSLEDRTPSDFGWLVSLREQRSTIPLRGAANGFESPNDAPIKEQTRANRSGMLRFDQAWGSGHSDLTLTYAPTDERYFIQNAKNSFFDLKAGGPVVSLRDRRRFGAWQVSSRLGHSDLDSSRRSDAGYWKSWRWSTQQNWGAPTSRTSLSTEGSWGDVDQRQTSTDASFSIDRDAFAAFGLNHRVALGVDLEAKTAFYERLNDHFVYLRPTPTTTCTNSTGSIDTEGCSLAPTLFDGRGQFFSQRDIYQVGRIEAEVNRQALWIENDAEWQAWSLRLGLRYDRDDLMAQSTLSPRASARWSFDEGRQALVLGANRYYGRNFFSNLLRDGREGLKITQTRSVNLIYGMNRPAFPGGSTP